MGRGLSVMEDEGTRRDHTAGFAATDGRWHHIAITWSSDSGATMLYDNGRLAWQVRSTRVSGHDSGCSHAWAQVLRLEQSDEDTVEHDRSVCWSRIQ